MKALPKAILCVLIILLVVLSGCFGGDDDSDKSGDKKDDVPEETGTLTVLSVEAVYNDDPKLSMGSNYKLDGFTLDLTTEQYQLPLDTADIQNFNDVKSKLGMDSSQQSVLKTNGFVIIDFNDEDDIVEPYKYLKENEVPIFVTSDTVLHLYHIQFDETLKSIEENEFFDDLIDMSLAMMERSEQDYSSFSDSTLKEAARRNTAYFAVALELLQTPTEGYDEDDERAKIEQWNEENPWDTKTFEPVRDVSYTVPDYVTEEVAEELDQITAHSGFLPSPIFHYTEDYSQYVPRGHYTRSEELKRFFKSMMWYGRMAFLLKGSDVYGPAGDALISEEDADIATIGASLISVELTEVKANSEGGTDVYASDIWNRLYAVTAFFVGLADDLTPYEYLDAVKTVFGTELTAADLADDEKLLELKAELAELRSPEIYGGTGNVVIYPPITKEKLDEVLEKTKGMRFMGQRFVPDSYIFQNLVAPTVGPYTGTEEPFTMEYTLVGPERCFPRGLDVMAVMGSERALEILEEDGDTDYVGTNTSYDKQLELLQAEFNEFDAADWNRNLYWSWLYTLDALLKDYDEGYPTFMKTEAWQDKELQTVLASWSELRHDTILYAKQSYTPKLEGAVEEPEPVVGYVEPVPEFYARILALTQMTREGLDSLEVISDTERSRLENLETVISRLLDIAKDELQNKELSEDDYEFIRNFGENLEGIVTGVDSDGLETTMVADVHTDCNTNQVLEEGVGYVDLIVVAYKLPDGRILTGAGPVFSYYEFKHPMNDRLTDESWKDMLESGTEPARPDWTSSIVA